MIGHITSQEEHCLSTRHAFRFPCDLCRCLWPAMKSECLRRHEATWLEGFFDLPSRTSFALCAGTITSITGSLVKAATCLTSSRGPETTHELGAPSTNSFCNSIAHPICIGAAQVPACRDGKAARNSFEYEYEARFTSNCSARRTKNLRMST